MYIAIEPASGLPVELVGRLQINILVEPSPYISPFKNAPTIFFPALWLEQKVQIPDELSWKLKLSTWMPIIGYICIAILIFIGAIILICTYTCKCQRGRTLELPG